MATILHPTRGGRTSYPNQDRAIALAQERGARLILLHLSNVNFLSTLASPVPVALVTAELDELGAFMLAMAQERAEEAGVAADTVVRHGSFAQALAELIKEYGVDTLVLGSPGGHKAITTSEYMQELIHRLHSEFGVEVLVVREGEIVEAHGP
jgi:nucleotide-binding universal stress UspA family protein